MFASPPVKVCPQYDITVPRCGWLEVLNKGNDRTFARYVDSLVAAKRLEVSSTTLPQMSIPPVMSDPRYPGHLDALTDAELARFLPGMSRDDAKRRWPEVAPLLG